MAYFCLYGTTPFFAESVTDSFSFIIEMNYSFKESNPVSKEAKDFISKVKKFNKKLTNIVFGEYGGQNECRGSFKSFLVTKYRF
jgi:hypothetical protein